MRRMHIYCAMAALLLLLPTTALALGPETGNRTPLAPEEQEAQQRSVRLQQEALERSVRTEELNARSAKEKARAERNKQQRQRKQSSGTNTIIIFEDDDSATADQPQDGQ